MDELTRKMYKDLGIAEDAPLSEIDARYHELVKRYQAEQSSEDLVSRQEAWARLKDVSSAYEIVKKHWNERNRPSHPVNSDLNFNGWSPGSIRKKKRSTASVAIVTGLICIAIVYYGYGFMKRPNSPATAAHGELRLFTTPR